MRQKEHRLAGMLASCDPADHVDRTIASDAAPQVEIERQRKRACAEPRLPGGALESDGIVTARRDQLRPGRVRHRTLHRRLDPIRGRRPAPRKTVVDQFPGVLRASQRDHRRRAGARDRLPSRLEARRIRRAVRSARQDQHDLAPHIYPRQIGEARLRKIEPVAREDQLRMLDRHARVTARE